MKTSHRCLVSVCILCLLSNAFVSGVFAEPTYVVVPAQKTFVSAESRLKDFAKKAEDSRMQSAMYGVGLGLLYVSLGASFSQSSYYSRTSYPTIYYGIGAGMIIMGIGSYLYPTALENNYGKIRQMAASTVKERAAREAVAEKTLKQGADDARQSRTMGSALFIGVGALTGGSLGLLYAGLGAMSYLMKSDIEKAYEEYAADKEDYIRSQPAVPVVVPSTVEAEAEPVTTEATPEAQ